MGKATRRRKKQEWAIEKLLIPCKRLCSRTCIRETVVPKTTRAEVSEVKKKFSCVDLAGEGRNSVLHYNFAYTNSFRKKDLKKALHNDFLL